MVPHPDTAAVETPPEPTAEIPTEAPEPTSFTDAIDAALQNFGETPEPEPEPAPEPEPEPEPEPTPESTPEPEPESTPEPEPETSADADPLEQLTEDLGDWTPKAANRFKQLKTELKTNRSELETLQQTLKEQASKIKELTGAAETASIEELQAKLAEYEQEKALTDLTGTSAYKETVAAPLQALVDSATSIAEKYGADVDKVIDALAIEDQTEQDTVLNDLLFEASSRDKAKIYRIIEDLNPILQKRYELYQNADEALKEATAIEEQRQNAKAAERAQIRANVTQTVAERVVQKLPFLKGVEGVDMEAIRTKASELDPHVVHPVDFAYNSIAAQLLPTIVREYLSSRKEADNLADKLATYEGAEPTMSGASAGTDSTRPSNEMSFTDAINAALGGA